MRIIIALLVSCLAVAGCPADDDDDATGAPEYVVIDLGYEHGCVIRDDGKLMCWGDNSSGQLDVDNRNYSQISAGHGNTCALDSSGTITCWGGNLYGQSNPTSQNYAQIDCGGVVEPFCCGVTEKSEIECWGSDLYGQASPPNGEFEYISVGGVFACALATSGEVVCWGSCEEEQCTPPANVLFHSIDASYWAHVCGVTYDSTVVCWGCGGYGYSFGQCDGVEEPIKSVSTGAAHTCYLGQSNRVMLRRTAGSR